MLETILQPLFSAALQFVIAVVASIAPEIASDISAFFGETKKIIADAITLQMTPGEALDSLKISANELKAKGETIGIQLQASAEKFPAAVFGALTGFLGSSISALEKIAGL